MSVCVCLCAKRSRTTVTALGKGEVSQDGENKKRHKKEEQEATHCREVAAFSSQLKTKVGHILAKAAALRVNSSIDGAPIASRSHTHPSHSQTSRLFFLHEFPSCSFALVVLFIMER